MGLKTDAPAAAAADREQSLEQARREAAYYRGIAEETGRNHIRNMFQLSRMVAELRDVELRLRESEERYRSVVENLNVGMTVTLDEKIVFANSAVAAALGQSVAELISNPDPFGYIHPEDRAMVRENHFKRISGEEAPERYCFRVLTQKGETRWAEATCFRIQWQGRPAILKYFIDVTERVAAQETQKRLEQQLVRAQKMEALGTLAGGIAHDFNNLMAAVLAYISLMLHETEPSHPHYDYLANVERLIRRGSKLTSQLLGYARHKPYRVKPIALNQLVAEVAETFGRTRKNVHLHLSLEPDLRTIKGEPSQLEQALLNLFVNASDAMPNGGELHLATRNTGHADIASVKFQPAPGDYVGLQVADTGTGMSPDILDRIFDPFFTTKEPGRGTGLGLASVFGIVKGHDGYIDVASQPGQGTTFGLYFPAVEQEPLAPSRSGPAVTILKGTVLVVDDEPLVLDTCARMLAKLGFTVHRAGGGAEALEIFRRKAHELDLVILDVVMPGIGGEEVYRQIKEMQPDARVLISSGFDSSGRITDALNANRDDFLRKPFSLGELSEKIQQLMRPGRH